MRKTQGLKWVTVVAFLLMVAVGTVASFVLPQREYSDRENRMLCTRPEFDWRDVLKGSYQKQYEKSLSDQIFWRDKWTALSSEVQKIMGNKDINGVYVGADGYLLEKYKKKDFKGSRIRENATQLADFMDEIAFAYGSEHVSCMMIPSKTSVMSDKLPAHAWVYDEGKVVAKVEKRLSDADLLFDASQILGEHADEYIFYRTDHHWTTLGAYYAYSAWAEKMGLEPGRLQEYQREMVFDDFYGTTFNKAHIHVPEDRVELFHHQGEAGITVVEDDGEVTADSVYFPKEAEKGFNRYDVFFSKNTFKITIETGAETGRTLLVIKDSFANCFVPFLLQDFDEIIMLDYRYGKEPVGQILNQYPEVTDILVMYNTYKFAGDTNLRYLNIRDKKESSMEEFDAEEFFSELE